MSAGILTSISPWILLLIGALLNAIAGFLALWKKAVDPGGAAAGAVLGTVIFTAGGPLLWLLLAAFFLSSNALTRLRTREKEWLSRIQEKGGRRDAFQVIANGGVGMIAAVLLRTTNDPRWAVAFAVAFASANADTWASEVGVLSRASPVSLMSLRPVPRGMSGGVTLLGLAAGLGGSVLIAVLFGLENLLVTRGVVAAARLACVTAGAGFLGCLIDSILGSTLQAQYAAPGEPAGGAVTERRVTRGVENTLVRGLPFVTNDVVNAASITVAAAAAFFSGGIGPTGT